MTTRLDLDSARFGTPPDRDTAEPVFCVIGDTLCRVRVWTEAEWERIDPSVRPSPHIHVPGLGWIGAVVGHR
jgi:hypothetical protein